MYAKFLNRVTNCLLLLMAASLLTSCAVKAEGEDTSIDVGLDSSLFFEGALVDDIVTQDCTLSDGIETACYEITIAGYPADYDVGPFCPSTIEASAEEAGIWFDGDAV